MAKGATVGRRRRGHRHHRPHHRRLPAAGPDPEGHPRPGSSPCPGVTDVKLDWTELDAGREGRRHGQGPLERAGATPPTPRSRPPPGSSPWPRARAAWASRRSPSTWPPRSPPGLHRRRARRRHLGLLGPPHAGRRGPPRRATTERRSKIVPNIEARSATGLLEVVSMGFLVDDEESALMWRGLMLNRAVQHFLEDVALGRPRLPAHRHAAGHRRRADGPGPHAAPGRDDHRHHAGRAAPRRWPSGPSNMARKSYLRVAGVIENMSAFTCDHGDDLRPVRRGRRRGRWPTTPACPLLGQIPLEPAVAAGGDAGEPDRARRRPGRRGLPGHRRPHRRRGRAPGGDGRLLAPACSTPPSPRSTPRTPRPPRPRRTRTPRSPDLGQTRAMSSDGGSVGQTELRPPHRRGPARRPGRPAAGAGGPGVPHRAGARPHRAGRRGQHPGHRAPDACSRPRPRPGSSPSEARHVWHTVGRGRRRRRRARLRPRRGRRSCTSTPRAVSCSAPPACSRPCG